MRRPVARLRTAAVLLALLVTAPLAAGPAFAADDSTLGARPAGEAPSRDSIPITVTVPGAAAEAGARTLTNAELRWALNAEAGSAAFFGGCNFLMAGRPGTDGDAGSATPWSDDREHLYHPTDGNVQIQRVVGTGADARTAPATWAKRCTAPDGTPVDLHGKVSGAEVVITGGTGTRSADGAVDIAWTGTFTVVFYGGMTYWWASDPVLHLDADGTGTLTATAGGFAADRDDSTLWAPLPATTVTLASFTRTRPLGDDGGLLAPDYCGVTATLPADATPQVRTDAAGVCWGSFPQDFVDFQTRGGQSSFWYTSGGARDPYKRAADVAVSFDAARSVGGASPPVPAASAPSVPSVLAPVTDLRPDTSAAGGVLPGATATARGGVGGLGSPTLADVAPVAAFPATPAVTLGVAAPGLVPGLAADDAPSTLAVLSTVLLLAATTALAGFRKGWLVLPFSR
ncbi:hypothetical protein Xcel_2763 [Xylanimonas cellulosilytica DSM 15894]|uniref:Htaa domain-containing protein n=1 Tax=Xylanimonas cellulosilytica (strain DSM 15894 / JCM 12276 / CECT 5975 / KCTC 9989 / LMG 20990 / NBRC 107835 / XIL07) TaxID=446471 RepID=D1BXY6_XYLCX|nr:hypothetical protein [Xylanimonas cellulosilytica]ACZ31777.1 hypothetical protein Xcel_2763 [Xylanimonas cellulosilytica DSM 15894]